MRLILASLLLVTGIAQADTNLAVICTSGATDGAIRSKCTLSKYDRPDADSLVRTTVAGVDQWKKYGTLTAGQQIEVTSTDVKAGSVADKLTGAPATSWTYIAASTVPVTETTSADVTGYDLDKSMHRIVMVPRGIVAKATKYVAASFTDATGEYRQVAVNSLNYKATSGAKLPAAVFVLKAAASADPATPADPDVPDTPIPPVTGAAIKWNPGNYAWFSPGAVNGVPGYRFDIAVHRDAILAFLDSIKNEPTVKGILVAGYPKSFEGDTAGDFAAGFAALDAILAHAQQYGKRVMVRYETGLFGNYGSIYDSYPRYLVDGSQYGYTKLISLTDGTYKGVTARMWQQSTMDRAIAVSAAYGARYNAHPNFEMITMIGETSISVKDGVDGFSPANYSAQIQRAMPLFRAAWPNTGIRIGANDMGADSNILALYDQGVKYGIAFGGPDVWPGDVTQADALFAKRGLQDTLPWAVEAQYQSFMGKWTPAQLWGAMASGYTGTDSKQVLPSLKVRYFIWYVNEFAGQAKDKWSSGTLPYIRSISGAVGSTACPSSYTGGCKAN